MSYLLLIVEPLGQREARSEAEGRDTYDRMLAYASGLKAQGVLLAAESLTSQAGAARVRVHAGGAQVVDGPFAEAKEMVGGYFLLNCATRDEAVALAALCPAAQWATVEVRELGPCFL
jgi:hypothetical protein